MKISRLAIILAALCWTLAELQFDTICAAQERSREEALKEAGRLGTEAERLKGEAYKQVQAGGSPELIAAAEREAAKKFQHAIELWRMAGDDRRLIAGVEELTRIYSVLGDYQGVIERLEREAKYWAGRGDLLRQNQTLWLMGLRQMQMRRAAAAIKTLEQVKERSRAASQFTVEYNALDTLAILYQSMGREKDAEACQQRSEELQAKVFAVSSEKAPLPMPATIPAQWIDLPTAPLVAEYREVNGVKQAVLVNRSSKGIAMVMFGCVAEEKNKTRVLQEIMGMGVGHGGVGPGFYYQPFSALNGPLNQWTDEKMGCQGAARMAVIEAKFADGALWKADGADWAVR